MRLGSGRGDAAFASNAAAKLKAEHIECFLSGDTAFAPPPRGEREYCIHIVSEADYVCANQILIELGAVQDEPPRLPTGRWVHVALFVLGAGAAVFVILLMVRQGDGGQYRVAENGPRITTLRLALRISSIGKKGRQLWVERPRSGPAADVDFISRVRQTPARER
ncbi:MAG: hypothetical protein JWO52_3811 [Gammaproteobacteria bacterium]|nr:hypothetical protein [Gammaproteobacteria bacterium]